MKQLLPVLMMLQGAIAAPALSQTVTVNGFTSITNMAGATQVTSVTTEIPIENVGQEITITPQLQGDLSTNAVKVESLTVEVLKPNLPTVVTEPILLNTIEGFGGLE